MQVFLEENAKKVFSQGLWKYYNVTNYSQISWGRCTILLAIKTSLH